MLPERYRKLETMIQCENSANQLKPGERTAKQWNAMLLFSYSRIMNEDVPLVHRHTDHIHLYICIWTSNKCSSSIDVNRSSLDQCIGAMVAYDNGLLH